MSYSVVKVDHARRVHKCAWCGENIEPGDEFERVSQRDGRAFHRSCCHIECTEALDQARFHSEDWFFVPDGRQVRGEYPCPVGVDSCVKCQDTPFRCLPRGEDKPALVKFNRSTLRDTDRVDHLFAMKAGWVR